MAAFNPANLVVYRIGDGTGSLINTGNAVFIDEYTVTGTLVQSIALPTVASGNNYQLIASGTATSEGLLTLSADGHYLMLTGYARDLGGSGSISGTAATVVPRVVGRIDGSGAIDTSTALTDAADSNNIRGATSTNGTDIWVSGGAGGIRYTLFDGDAATDLSTQVSTTLTNVREIEVFGGQLYASTQSGSAVRIGTVGTGTPTASGQTIANLPGLPTTGAPNGFFLADLSSAVAGIDTLYMADETAGLIRKYSLVGGNWIATGSITDAAVRGLTGSVSGGTVSLFGTTGDGDADGGGALTAFADTTGYNGTVSGSATVIATAGLNQVFRGVAFAPMAVASIAINDPVVSEGASGTTTLTYTVTRSGDTSGAVTFDIATANGTATSGSDYVAKSLTAQTIAAGATTFTFTVTVNGDTTPEPNETVLVNLTNVAGATLSDSQGSGTITNDDAADVTAPTLSLSNPVDNATGVAIAANIVLNFNEAVQAGVGNIILRPASGADITIPVGSGQVTFNGNQVIINPTADMRPGVAYDVIIASDVITDIANNAFAGIAADALDFTTSFEIPAGTFASTFTISDPGVFTLLAGGTRTQTAATAVQATVTAGSTTIDIEGILNDTASGQRAIRANLGGGGQITVGANGVVQSLDGDSIQVQSVNPTVNVTNLGQIISLSSTTAISTGGPAPAGAAFALNFNAVVGAAGAPSTDFTSGGVVTNGSAANTTALIRSDSGDAIRLGAHQTLINWGTIDGNGPINDSSTNNFLNPDPAHQSVAQRYDVSRGIRINAATSTNDTIENHGRIEGAQHAIDVGNVNATNIIVNNLAGATIVGHNGSGVGADTVGIAATTVQVENFGTILGEYAPQYDRAGYVTVDGDGDGVDVDGGATIINHVNALIAGSGAGGVLAGQGAGGFDSSGRANRSEGISIGGGLITNDGTISGANFGIIVNNDSNPDNSRSGVLATTVTNGATGSIIGQAGFAIRLENKTGTAADNDIIDNSGTITGNGSIPDPAGIVLRQNNLADPGVNGTLDGVTYTLAADAGNARFISGDGSAIQMGEGDDVLSNHGSIIGNSGRAINLEGGTDTLNLFTGQSIVGRIDGGAGTDSLHLKGSATGSISNVINFEALAVEGGTWSIADTESYANGVTVATGALLVDGSLGSSAVAVNNGGTLGGHGTVGAVHVTSGGTLSPGASAATLSTGNLSFVAGAHFSVEVGGAAADLYDRVHVTGTVDLGGATLDLALINGFDPHAASGTTFMVIDNDLADAVSGNFAGLSEGAILNVNGSAFQISYHGGDGNDVVLTAHNQLPAGTADAYVTNEDTPLAIAAPGVLANDTDADGDTLSVILVQGPAHGTLTLNADGSLLYSPFANYSGADNFTYRSNDGLSDSGMVNVGLTVNAVNDAPVNSGPAATINAQNGVSAAISGLAVHDVDAGSLTTSLHVEHGTLNVAAVAGGAAVAGSGTSTVTLTGSAAQIDAVLGAANNVLYHSAFDFTGLDHLTMTSNDGGSSGAGGALSDVDIFNITVAPQIAAMDLNGFTRPALNLDSSGHIIFDAAVAEAAAMYGTKFIFIGLPASTPTEFHLI